MPAALPTEYNRPIRAVVDFGTRPEVIKLAPVIAALADTPVFSSGQQTDLVAPFVTHFGVRIDHQLNVVEAGQPLNRLFARVLTEPDFNGLLSESWVTASDSDRVQEEAPSLGVPLLILRESTERPEVLDTGLAKLCPTGDDLAVMLNELYRTDATARPTDNPFGDGHAAGRIVTALAVAFGVAPAEVAV